MVQVQAEQVSPVGADDGGRDEVLVAGLVLEAEAALRRRLDADLRSQVGMPLPTFEALVLLRHAPGGRLRLSELGRRLSITTGGVTRLVDRIEAAGLIRRVPDPTDRRAAFAEITPVGEVSLQAATEVHVRSLQRDLRGPLDDAAYEALADAARLLRDHLQGNPSRRAARREGPG